MTLEPPAEAPAPATDRTADRTTDRRALIAFLLLVDLVVGVRLVLLLGVDGPATIDSGNWLAFGHDLLGPDVRSSSIVYPPVVPLLVVAATSVLGVEVGVAVVAAVTSALPAVGCFVVLWQARLRWFAVLLAGLVLAAGSSGEAAAWGGFPQLVALGLLPPTLWLLDRFLRWGGVRRGLAFGVALAIVLATSHFIATAAVASGAVLVGLHAVVRPEPRAPSWPRRLRDALPGLALSLPLVPLYLALTSVGRAAASSRPDTPEPSFADLPGAADYVLRDFRILWWCLAVVAVLVPPLLADRRRTPLWLVSVSSTATVVALFLYLRDMRVIYLLAPAGVLALGLLAVDVGVESTGRITARPDRPAALALALLLVLQALLGLQRFSSQVDYYAVAADGVSDGVVWVGEHTDADVLVAVAPVRGAPLGWWVEGRARRPALVGSWLRWLSFPDEQRRARVANAIFGPSFPTRAQVERARRYDVDLLLVSKAWSGYDRAAVSAAVARGDLVVRFQNRGVVVLGVRSPG
ncbi:MAG: hypothetical protein KF703_05810 [Actinobacteria bacterium]|nr:hypothetical protein [Actinomycetota bacterium]